MPRSAESDLGLHCLPMSQTCDARLIWVRPKKKYVFQVSALKNYVWSVGITFYFVKIFYI